MITKPVPNPWRYGWLLLSIIFLVIYILVYWVSLISSTVWNWWVLKSADELPFTPEFEAYLRSWPEYIAPTFAFLMGITGCIAALRKYFNKSPSLVLARLMWALFAMYLGAVLTLVIVEIGDPYIPFSRLSIYLLPILVFFYIVSLWVYHSKDRLPKYISNLVGTWAHIGLVLIPFGLLVVFGHATYWNRVGVIP